MIRKIAIVLLIPSLILGFLIKSFYNLKPGVYVPKCHVYFQQGNAQSSCTVELYNFDEINEHIISFVDAGPYELHQILLSGTFAATEITNDEITRKTCSSLSKDPNLLDKKYLNETHINNILKTKSISLFPTKTEGVLCSVFYPSIKSWGITKLIKISPEHLKSYNNMILKSKIINFFIILWEFIAKIIPFITLYIIFFLGLLVFYYLKISIKFLTKK